MMFIIGGYSFFSCVYMRVYVCAGMDARVCWWGEWGIHVLCVFCCIPWGTVSVCVCVCVCVCVWCVSACVCVCVHMYLCIGLSVCVCG